MSQSNKNVLDKYRVIAQLGRGGMADVYLAAAHGPGGFSKLMVVKVLQSSLARDPDFLAMFRDEARLAARLNHPNVVQTYEVGQSEDRHYIAMEYLEGQALHRVTDSFAGVGGLSLGMSLRIIVDALSGLHYAHDLRGFDGKPLGIVHRDITPQNIFVTYEGQTKVVDFGIAKAFDSTTHTKIGTVKGKVAYMAPEQARGEAVDRRADVFSVGILLWELLSGRRLWEGLTDIAVVGRLVQGDIPSIATIRPDLPPDLAELTMRALSPDPAKRPQTALAFQQELEAAMDRLPNRVSVRKLGEVMQEQFQRERAQVRSVVAKQLERLSRTTPSGATPPGGWKLQPNAGDMPIVGAAGSSVHEAVTTIHTGLTDAELSSSSSHRLGTGASQLHGGHSGSSTSSSHVTAITDAQLVAQNRNSTWIAIGAVGVAGLAIGVAQPWKSFTNDASAPASSNVQAASAGDGKSVETGSSASDTKAPPTRRGCDSTDKPIVELTGEISDDAVLSCDKDYLLRFTTYVTPGATLSIEAGTRLIGDTDTQGTLVVQPGAQIKAAGTKDRPIVFTSAAPAGSRTPGDWGGLIILGNAPVNLQDVNGQPLKGRVEGLTNGGEYGGSNPGDSSGRLSFVRIEYSGTEIAPNNEINGLTLGGVGRGTVIDHVQVRHTADDCFEFFGGTVDAKYLVCQSPGDDAFDWDYGYTGRLQYLVAQSDSKVTSGSNGFEGDNDPNGSKNAPISSPQIYNATLCGKNRKLDSKEHFGILLRRGSHVRVRNSLFIGFAAGLDVRDEGTKPNIAATTFFQNLVHNLAYPETEDATRADKQLFDDDGGFNEQVYLENEGLRIGTADPNLGNCFDQRTPGFKPRYPLLDNAAIPPSDGFFDNDARFVGAFRDLNDDWDAGTWLRWGE